MTDAGVEALLETRYGLLTYDRTKGQVSLVRTREPLTADAIEAEVERLVAAVAGLPIGELSLLVDVRAPVGRNDDAFEGAIRTMRQRFMAPFRRVAVLVRTRVGLLQGGRFVREDRSESRVRITDDPAAADAFLAGS